MIFLSRLSKLFEVIKKTLLEGKKHKQWLA